MTTVTFSPEMAESFEAAWMRMAWHAENGEHFTAMVVEFTAKVDASMRAAWVAFWRCKAGMAEMVVAR